MLVSVYVVDHETTNMCTSTCFVLGTSEQVKEEQIKKKKCCEFIDKLEEDDVFENISLVSPMVDYVYENKMLEKKCRN